MDMHVCEVKRALGSVSSMCRAGNTVMFDSEGSYILDKQTGSVKWLREEEGVYVLDLDIAPHGHDPIQGFGRQGY